MSDHFREDRIVGAIDYSINEIEKEIENNGSK